MIIRHLIAPLTVAVLAFHAIEARAQSAFSVPLPGASAAQRSDSAFPTLNDVAPAAATGGAPGAFPSIGGVSQAGGPGGDDCMNGFLPLRQEAEARGAMIKTASDRHAPPDEACKLIGNFAQSEIKMIKYVEAHVQQCGILAQVGEQMRTGHRNTESMLKKVCNEAKEQGGSNRSWLKLADRLRLSWKQVIFEGLILEGLGDHQTLSEELS